MKKAWRGRIIRPVSEDSLDDFSDGLLIVDEHGKIEYCSQFDSNVLGDTRVQENKSSIIIPGFVDSHVHLAQLSARGTHGDNLLSWLKNFIYPTEILFNNSETAQKTSERFYKELINNGITCAGVLLTTNKKSCEIAIKEGIKQNLKLSIGKAIMDANAPDDLLEDSARSLEESDELFNKYHEQNNGKIRYAYYPRFALTCSKKIWAGLGKRMQGEGITVHTHVAETKKEYKQFSKMFPGYKDYYSLFEDVGLVGERVLLAHCIYLSENEFVRMGKDRTKIVHCPSSNLFLKSGRFPLGVADKAGVAFSLGSDIGAGPRLWMFNTMKNMEYLQMDIKISPERLFYLATAGGAEVLGWKNHNKLMVDTPADFLILDPNKLDEHISWKDIPANEVLSEFIYRSDNRVLDEVYVDGECIKKHSV